MKNMFLKLQNKLFDLSVPVVMGIINITPDSFYANSRHSDPAKILNSVEKILSEGGKIIDIGGYSSRPSADNVSSEQETERLSYALEIILKEFPDIIVSVDTFRADVARKMVKDYGVAIINDIGGGTLDKDMYATIAELQVAYILMHMKGTPATMQSHTQYDDMLAEVFGFFQSQLAELRKLGVNDVILDPGFGFAKDLKQNYTLLKNMHIFSEIDAPVLAGVSRKSMIYNLLDIDPVNALNGTTAVNMLALIEGASILRVHDVKEAVESVKIYQQYINS